MSKRFSIEHFQTLAKERGGECLSAKYINGTTKLEWLCAKGHTWLAQPRKVQLGGWCRECAFDRIRKYTHKDDIFSEDNERSFYLAGFWAADGWVSRATGAYSVALTLAKKDYDHLKMIHSLFETNCNIRYREQKSPKSDTMCFSHTFVMSSKQMFNDLGTRFNVVQKKTYKYSMPDWLVEHPLVHHFIRGYIDGDGCFSIAENKNQSKHILFCMRGTAICLKQIHQILVRNGVVNDLDRVVKANEGKFDTVFGKLTYSGNARISKMYDYLYKDATIYLDRKKIIAAKSKDLAIYGNTGRRKKHTSIIHKEELLEKAKELKSQKKVAEYFGCTSANITHMKKVLGVSEEFAAIVNRRAEMTKEVMLEKAEELGSQSNVAEFFDCSTYDIRNRLAMLGISDEFKRITSERNKKIAREKKNAKRRKHA